MTGFVALGLLLGLLAVLFVLYPIVRPGSARAEAAADSAELAGRRYALYRQIVEIEFDERVGKIEPADARALTSALLEEAAGLLATESSAVLDREREIEREIAAVRRALAAAREIRLETVQP